MRTKSRGSSAVDWPSGVPLVGISALMGTRGVPKHIRSDNGSEFIAKQMRKWLEKMDKKMEEILG